VLSRDIALKGLLIWFWGSALLQACFFFYDLGLIRSLPGQVEVFPAKMPTIGSLTVNGAAQVQSLYDSLKAKVALYQKVLFLTFLKINHGMASAMPMGMSNRAATITLSFAATAAISFTFQSTSTVLEDGLAITTMM